VVGDSHLDPIKLGLYADAKEVRDALSIPDDDNPVLVLQHSETTQVQMAYTQMHETLTAASQLPGSKIVVLPSTDVGADAILEAVEKFDGSDNFHFVANLDSRLFLGLLRISRVFLGNSSAGVIEAPFMGVPSVSIGRRQEGRETYGAVIRCHHEAKSILDAAKQAMTQAPEPAHRCMPENEDPSTSVERVRAGLMELLPEEGLMVKRFVIG
jgi:UDP-N-acetylglucosamine 2-epimerase